MQFNSQFPFVSASVAHVIYTSVGLTPSIDTRIHIALSNTTRSIVVVINNIISLLNSVTFALVIFLAFRALKNADLVV